MQTGKPPVPQPATTPAEILRVVLSVALVLFIIVALPAMVAKVSQRGSMPDVTAWLHTVDAQSEIRVYDTGSESASTMPLNDYILGVLSAEFSPTTPIATLEAAAVATRTYAVHAMLTRKAAAASSSPPANTAGQAGSPAPTLPSATATAASGSTPGGFSLAIRNNADVTNDSQLDLPMATKSDVEAQYPHKALRFLSNAQAAIEKTDGLVLTYQGQPILAFMFDLSPGKTRSSQAVFGHNLPYLQAVNCPDDASDPDRISTTTRTPNDVAQVFGESSVALASLKLKRASDGFVLSVTDGRHTVSGGDFAAKLGLPSADFKWNLVNGNLNVTTYGRGTDLGMSLHEATVLASKGNGWKSIVSHFYPDTNIQLDDRYRI